MTNLDQINRWQGASKVVDTKRALRFGAWYVAEYRILNMRKWIGSILAFGLGNPVLFLASVGLGIGALVDANNGGAGINGVPYLTFVAPALMATAGIQAAMDETMFPVMHGFVWEKIFYAINATSVSARQVANGVLIAALLRTLLTVLIYYIILVLFGAVSSPTSWLTIPAAFFAGMAFGSLMLAVAVKVEQDDGFFAIIGRFVVAPMFLFSGTFYPLTILPIYLQWVGWISPLWHATEIGRFLSYGHEITPLMLLVHFCYLIGITVLGLRLAYPMFDKRLAR